MTLRKWAVAICAAVLVTGALIGAVKTYHFSRFVITSLKAQSGKQAEIATVLDQIKGSKAAFRGELEAIIAGQPDLVGTSAPIAIQRADKESLTPVSMTRVAPDKYLFVNYRNVYLLDIAGRTAIPVFLDKAVPVWNPTSIFYSPFHDKLFIANYTGQDILIVKLDESGDRPVLRLEQRLTNEEGIVGPEGAVVSPGGRYMAVASYEGNATALFEMVDGQWVFRWKRPVISSHGVAIVGDYVYGSGTTIAKFRIKDGKEVARTRTLVDEAIQFVTCLDYDETTGALFGSDTMAGRVFSMDRDLKVTSVFGANGPTTANLSMPYCAYREGKATYILSTFQERILKIEDGRTISFEMRNDYWPYLDATLPQQKLSRDAWTGVVKSDHPTLSFFGKKISPSYGSVTAEDGTDFVLPTRQGSFSAGWLHYVTTTARDGQWIVIASISVPAALLINGETGELAFARTGEFDCWAASLDLLCPSRRYSVDDLLASSKRIAPLTDLEAIARAMGVTSAELLEEISSEGATKLKAAILEGESGPAARDYLAWANGKRVPLIEYWIATALSRTD